MRFQLTSHQIELSNCTIFYKQGGIQSKETPILFLHGWGISVDPYQEVLELLAQEHAVIAPDLPSFARSSYSGFIPDYKGYAQILIAFLDALKLEKVHLIGHSFGGGLSITLAALFPARVASAVLVGSTGIPSASLLEIVPIRAVEMTIQTFLPRLELKFFKIPLAFSHNLLFNLENVLQVLLLSLQDDLRHLLPTIQAPCLLLWSDKDLTIPLSIAHEMAAKIPNAKLTTVEEGCHEWGLWYPEKLISIALDFVVQTELAGQPVSSDRV